jgi:pantoate--beta-alanine ligase
MFEIEQKYAGADFAALQRALRDRGAAGPRETVEEADHYFNAPDRDFARTDEAFRLRRVGEENFFTFKGPRQKAAVRIRPELEFPLRPGAEAAEQHMELLRRLGYRAVAVVKKRRAVYDLKDSGLDVHVCLDEVEELGRFAEVEVVAPEAQAERAAAVLTRLAEQLGLRDVEPRSYLALLLAKRAAAPSPGQPAVVTTIADLRRQLGEARRQRLTVGLVPTMGALHEGHASLIRAARSRNDFVVVSVFVNPAQFGPHEDLSRYPRPFEDDVRLCASLGVDLIFRPEPAEIYPPGYRTYVEVTGLQDAFEGASRPRHFRGVATVVLKLFNEVQPDRAYFGQKDAQQARIIQQMVRDLDVPVEVVVCPTVREPDGLALSSRNRYLDPDQRRHAAALHAALTDAQALYRRGERDAARLQQAMRERIEATPGARLDYAAVIDADTFQPAATAEARGVLLAVAVRFGETRLIDNLPLSDDE